MAGLWMHPCLYYSIIILFIPVAMPNYYDDQKQLVATDTAELLIYFNSLPNVTAYEITTTLPCSVTAVINVSGKGLPKFMYLGSPIPKNKIYPKLLPSNTVNLDSLCNGIAGNLLPAPDCGTVEFEAFIFPAPDCGTVVFESGYAEQVLITPNSGAGWALYGDIISTVDINGVVTLNASFINSGITTHTLFTSEFLGTGGTNARPFFPVVYESANHPNMPPSSSMDILTLGDLLYTGHETSLTPLGAVIEIYNIQYNINH